ncbi:MAG: hypothetical protein Q8O92_01705 [Candidatus Latescibacter sp.]|nr:hypothetical protein [Candidatus Latescibacter sp.]
MNADVQSWEQLLFNAAIGALESESVKKVMKVVGDKFHTMVKHKDNENELRNAVREALTDKQITAALEKEFPQINQQINQQIIQHHYGSGNNIGSISHSGSGDIKL